MLADAAAVLEDLGGVRVLLGRHVPGLFEQRQVDERRGVALRTGVAVPVPRAAEVAALLDDADVVDAGLLQRGAGDQTGEPAADEGDGDLVEQRLPLDRLDVGVVEVVGEHAHWLDVLVVAVVAEPLVALVAVLAVERLPVDRGCPFGRSAVGHVADHRGSTPTGAHTSAIAPGLTTRTSTAVTWRRASGRDRTPPRTAGEPGDPLVERSTRAGVASHHSRTWETTSDQPVEGVRDTVMSRSSRLPDMPKNDHEQFDPYSTTPGAAGMTSGMIVTWALVVYAALWLVVAVTARWELLSTSTGNELHSGPSGRLTRFRRVSPGRWAWLVITERGSCRDRRDAARSGRRSPVGAAEPAVQPGDRSGIDLRDRGDDRHRPRRSSRDGRDRPVRFDADGGVGDAARARPRHTRRAVRLDRGVPHVVFLSLPIAVVVGAPLLVPTTAFGRWAARRWRDWTLLTLLAVFVFAAVVVFFPDAIVAPGSNDPLTISMSVLW